LGIPAPARRAAGTSSRVLYAFEEVHVGEFRAFIARVGTPTLQSPTRAALERE
jgi:hypothetical protein